MKQPNFVVCLSGLVEINMGRKEMTMIIEIRPGEGGDDAKLFMQDLGSAYAKYLETIG